MERQNEGSAPRICNSTFSQIALLRKYLKMVDMSSLATKSQHEHRIIVPGSSISISPVEKNPMETGHPINNKYKREFNEFRAAFNSYMENKPVKHDSVFVLIWTWANEIDDLKVKEEVCTLCSTVVL